MEDNNNMISTRKGGSTGLGIIIGLLLAAVIGLGTYFVSKEFLNKDNTSNGDGGSSVTTPTATPSNNKETEKELSINSDTVKKLSKVVGAYKNEEVGSYKNYFYKNDKVILDNEPVKFKLSLALSKADSSIFKENKNNFNPQTGNYGFEYISENDVKDVYKNMFGADNDYTRTSFEVGCGSFTWSSENNRYEKPLLEGCGGASGERIISKISSAKQIISSNSDKIEIYEKLIYETQDSIYADYEKTIIIQDNSTVSNVSGDELLNKYIDKASTYKYTFVKDDSGIYVFTSVEKVK